MLRKVLIAMAVVLTVILYCGLAAAEKVNVGDVITFGHYEQDNDLNNGPEPIRWTVLEVDEQNNKALIMCLNTLDAIPYHSSKADTTWEKSFLRQWMNSTFLDNAFSAEEQSAIVETLVKNSREQGHPAVSTSGGEDTTDKVFALSYAEARYYPISSGLPTEFSIARGVLIDSFVETVTDQNQTCWWLRSPGYDAAHAFLMDAGSRLVINMNVATNSVGVCPVLWLSLQSELISTGE